MTQEEAVECGTGAAPPGISRRLQKLEADLLRLFRSPAIPFDSGCRSSLPELPGVYRIFDLDKPDETIRAGRTTSAAGGLRQRVYQNHLMGNQAGNLRAQMVTGGECPDIDVAKELIRNKFGVQVLVVENSEERAALEHFMLAVLQPRYADKRGLGETGG